MKLSSSGLQLLKQLEGGFQSKAYADSTGYSIGYGHFILPFETRLYTTQINESVASVMLQYDVKKAENYVNDKKLTLNQNQFDALVLFVYNVGSWGTGFDTLLKNKKFSLLPAKWREYTIANKKVNPSLISRREKEIALFLSASMPSLGYLLIPLLFSLFFFR